MYTEQNSMIVLGKMQKCIEEIMVTSGDGKRDNRKIEVFVNEGKREKIVLRLSRCPIQDCAKEEDLMKRRCEWKVSTPSSSQTNTVIESDEENKRVTVNRPGSADDEKLVTIVDVSDPWSVIKEGKIRKLKIKEMNELCQPCFSKTEKRATYIKPSTTEFANISALKEVFSKSLFVIGSKAPHLKKSTKSFTNYKAELKRVRRDRRSKQNKTSTCLHKRVTLQQLFVVGQKTSLKNAKNKFKDYRAYKAGLKRYKSNQDVKQNQISKNFQIKRARKRL